MEGLNYNSFTRPHSNFTTVHQATSEVARPLLLAADLFHLSVIALVWSRWPDSLAHELNWEADTHGVYSRVRGTTPVRGSSWVSFIVSCNLSKRREGGIRHLWGFSHNSGREQQRKKVQTRHQSGVKMCPAWLVCGSTSSSARWPDHRRRSTATPDVWPEGSLSLPAASVSSSWLERWSVSGRQKFNRN